MKKTCERCLKRKWFVKQRKYIIPSYFNAPITSKGVLCRTCDKFIRKEVMKNINETIPKG